MTNASAWVRLILLAGAIALAGCDDGGDGGTDAGPGPDPVSDAGPGGEDAGPGGGDAGPGGEDAGPGGGDAGGDGPSFATDVYAPILATSCSPCHTGGASGGLSMSDAETAYANLVGEDSALYASCGDGVRVVPGDPDASVLYQKVTGANTTDCGERMPRGGAPLSADDQEAIRAWIAAGAAP